MIPTAVSGLFTIAGRLILGYTNSTLWLDSSWRPGPRGLQAGAGVGWPRSGCGSTAPKLKPKSALIKGS